MVINIQDDILKLRAMGLLDDLLVDKTTKQNIIWATDTYSSYGTGYGCRDVITTELITGTNASIIKTRARKAMEQQSERTRQHAEVFSPLWICKKMNDHADAVWSGKNWMENVDSRRLEITCGEAPYLVSRYDVETGEAIPILERIGLLDRKLRAVSENAQSEEEWLKWAIRAFWATYGYDYQGDNVLISRVNLLMTFEEYLWERWKRRPTPAEYRKLITVVTWNIWQMDGLTGTIPYGIGEEEFQVIDWFGMLDGASEHSEENKQPRCLVHNWTGGGIVIVHSQIVPGIGLTENQVEHFQETFYIPIRQPPVIVKFCQVVYNFRRADFVNVPLAKSGTKVIVPQAFLLANGVIGFAAPPLFAILLIDLRHRLSDRGLWLAGVLFVIHRHLPRFDRRPFGFQWTAVFVFASLF